MLHTGWRRVYFSRTRRCTPRQCCPARWCTRQRQITREYRAERAADGVQRGWAGHPVMYDTGEQYYNTKTWFLYLKSLSNWYYTSGIGGDQRITNTYTHVYTVHSIYTYMYYQQTSSVHIASNSHLHQRPL